MRNRRNRVVAGQSADADGLPFVSETDLRLSAQRDVLEGLPVDRPGGGDAALEADDLAVAHQQRPVHVAMRQVEADDAAALAGHEAAIAHRAGVVRVELQGDRAGVLRADIEGQVLDVVVKPIRRAEAAAPHDGFAVWPRW